MERDIPAPVEQGFVLLPGLETRTMEMPRHAHPAWNGVSVKDLVTAEETDGSSRYLPVRISRTCAIAGTEPLRVDEREVSVRGRGQTFVTPPRTHQIVSAGDVELSLLALVVPALA